MTSSPSRRILLTVIEIVEIVHHGIHDMWIIVIKLDLVLFGLLVVALATKKPQHVYLNQRTLNSPVHCFWK